jgi:hypothetical protein
MSESGRKASCAHSFRNRTSDNVTAFWRKNSCTSLMVRPGRRGGGDNQAEEIRVGMPISSTSAQLTCCIADVGMRARQSTHSNMCNQLLPPKILLLLLLNWVRATPDRPFVSYWSSRQTRLIGQWYIYVVALCYLVVVCRLVVMGGVGCKTDGGGDN